MGTQDGKATPQCDLPMRVFSFSSGDFFTVSTLELALESSESTLESSSSDSSSGAVWNSAVADVSASRIGLLAREKNVQQHNNFHLPSKPSAFLFAAFLAI